MAVRDARMSARKGFLIPFLGRLLPVVNGWTPVELLKRRWPDDDGKMTDAYVLICVLVLGVWLAAVGVGVRWVAVAIIVWFVVSLGVFLLKWLFVDQEIPHEPRAVLLFLLNLLQLRFAMCLTAVLIGGVPVSQRWVLFRGAAPAGLVEWWIALPYQLLTWLLIGIAIGAVAGSLRTRS